MKISIAETEKLDLNALTEIVKSGLPEAFKREATKVVFEWLSYTSDGSTRPKDSDLFATATYKTDSVDAKAELTLGDVKGLVTKIKGRAGRTILESYDQKGTGDGDGSTIHRLIGFEIRCPMPQPA